MHVRAVAIFEKNSRGKYVIRAIAGDQGVANRFEKYTLRPFIKQNLNSDGQFPEEIYNETLHDNLNTNKKKYKDEHFYFQINSKTKHVLLIAPSLDAELNKIESGFLLANINFIDQDVEELKADEDDHDGARLADMKSAYLETRLLEILTNPIAYRSRETRFNFAKIDKVRGEMDKTMAVMKNNIEVVLERGEKIEELVEKTDSLLQSATLFRQNAEDLKDSQGCCSGVRSAARRAGRATGLSN